MSRRMKMLTLLAVIAAAWWVHWSCQDRRSFRDVGRAIEEGRSVNVMILCPNREEALEAAVLISYEPLSGRLVMFHVPSVLCLDGTSEDSRPQRDGHLPATLESAYAKLPVDDLHRKLQTFFGPELSFTARLPEEKIYRLVDLMGGIFVNVPARISFRNAGAARVFDPVEEWIEIPQGEEVFFDSDKTKMYLTYRFDGLGIRGQMFRARRLAAAFLLRMKSHLDYDWFRAEVLSGFSNAPPESVLPLLKAISNLPAASIDVQPMPGQPDLNAGVFWASKNTLKLVLPKELKPLIRAGLPKSRIVVQLLNGSGAPNIAARLREHLSAYPDIDIVEIGNADRQDYDMTHILDRGGHLRSAERVRDLVGTGVLRQDVNPKALLDVTVIIGRDIK